MSEIIDTELALVEAFAFHHRIDLYYRRIL